MKIKIYSLLLLMLMFTLGFSQTKSPIELIGHNYVQQIGADTRNSASITLPKGKNRILIVTYWIERFHSPRNSNLPYVYTIPDNTTFNPPFFTSSISPAVNSKTDLKAIANSMSGVKEHQDESYNSSLLMSYHQQSSYLDIGSSEVDQIVTLNYGIQNVAKSAQDELVMSYAVYSNVSKLSVSGATNSDLRPRVGWLKNGGGATLTNYEANHSVTYVPTIPPDGRTPSEVVVTGFTATSKANTSSFGITGNPNVFETMNIINGNGGNSIGAPSGDINGILNEHDGVAVRRFDFNRGGLNPLPSTNTFDITKEGNVYYAALRVHVATLLPLAMPEYSGQVYVDNNGSTIGGATGKPAADYVYVIDNVTGKVIYKATVAADGKFVINEGYIEESSSYTLQLSNVNVNVGDSKPATTLNPGYGYTRESLDNVSGNIENPGNGEITINNAGVTGINTIAFGVQGISAVNDSYAATATQGVSGVTFPGSVLTNDSFNGVAPTLSNVNITNIINPTSAGKPVPTLSASTGLVTVPPGTPAGTYTITYSICDKTDNVPCSNTATVTVVVPTTTIVADEDNFTSSPISSISGGTTTSIFANDNYNGGAEGSVNSTNSTLSQVGTWNINFTLNADGTITVAAGTAPGSYVMNYRICDKINPTVCDDAQVTILVNATILADDDNYNVNSTTAIAGGNVGNILNNDNYNGGPDGSATVSNVIITSPAPTSATVPYINLATGDVVVPAGTPAGNYTINYTICDKVNGSPCDPAVVTVNVAAVTVQADDDNYSSTSIVSQNGGTLPSVLLNDNYNGGADGSATVGLAGNVNLSTVGTWTPGITLNSDGTIAVAPGTNPGTYTLTYRICDKVFPTICDDAQVTVVVALGYCFELPITNASQKVNTKHGITSLGRAYADGTNWPSVRQSAWTVLEAKTKGFVVNRVPFNSAGQPVGIAASNYVEGMMVYDTTNNCLKIYNGTVWSCFSTPACP